MKRPVKIGIGIVAVLAIVVVAAVVFLFASLDSLVETAIEEIGSEATQASVQLDQALLVSGDQHEVVPVCGDEGRQLAAESLGSACENCCAACPVYSLRHGPRTPQWRFATEER